MKARAENISRQLCGWADSLQNSEIKGQRYLNNKARQSAEREREIVAVEEELRRIRESG